MSDVKFCKDCKFAKPDNWMVFGRLEWAKCTLAPAALKVTDKYLVTGKVAADKFYFCKTERSQWGLCGPDGKLWEAKP